MFLFYLILIHQCQGWYGAGLFLLKWLWFSVPMPTVNFLDRSFSWQMSTTGIKTWNLCDFPSQGSCSATNERSLYGGGKWIRLQTVPDSVPAGRWRRGYDGAKSQTFSKELIYHSSAMASGGSDFCQIDGAAKRLWCVYQNSLDFPSGRHCKKALVIVSC